VQDIHLDGCVGFLGNSNRQLTSPAIQTNLSPQASSKKALMHGIHIHKPQVEIPMNVMRRGRNPHDSAGILQNCCHQLQMHFFQSLEATTFVPNHQPDIYIYMPCLWEKWGG